jgi:PAS domain S-box-containing protein
MHEHCTHFRDAKGNIVKSIGTVQDITELVRTEERVKKSEASMQRTQSIAHVGSWQFDLETNCLDWSDEAYRIFGVPPEKFNGTYEAFLKTVHPDDRERVNTAYTDSIRNGQDDYEVEHRIVWPDGAVRHLHEKCIHERDDEGTVIRSVGFCHDITERKQHELMIQDNRKLLDDVINAMPDMLWMKDANGVFLTCNREFEKLAGVSREELIGTTDYDHFNKDQADICCEQDRAALKNGIQSTHIEPMTHATLGCDVWYEVIKTPVCDSEGQPLGVLGVGRDITERKQAENALAESEEKYRALFENAPLSYQSLNEDGCFIDVNPAWLRILGYEREEVIGNWFGDFLHPDFVQHFATNFPAFKKRGYVKDVQFRIRHKNGTYRHIEFEGCIGYLPDGSFRQTYCVFQDITERKVTEEKLAASEELFRTLAVHAPAGIFMCDAEGLCTYVNPSWQEMAGMTQDQALGDGWAAGLHPEDRDDVFKTWRHDMQARGNWDLEYRFRTPEGKVTWVQGITKELHDRLGKLSGHIGIYSDITERKAAEEALKEKEQRYRGLLEQTGDAMFMHDRSGRIIDVNDFACASLDYTREELLQMTVADIDPDAGERNDAETVWGNELYHPVVFEARHQKKNGDIFHVEVRHSMVRHNGATLSFGFARDITERKQAEKQLANHHAELEEKVEERTQELRTIVNAMAGREVRMAELKEEIDDLKAQLKQADSEERS